MTIKRYFLLLAALLLTGCQHANPVQDTPWPDAEIIMRGVTQESKDYHLRWIFPGELGLGMYTAGGEFALDCQSPLAKVPELLSGQFQTKVKSETTVHEVITEPAILGSCMVGFTFRCPASMPYEERLRIFCDAYHLDYEIHPAIYGSALRVVLRTQPDQE